MNLRKQAEEFLNNALQSQMGQFMVTLVQALATEDFAAVGRQAAGLYLKNVLDAKDATLQQQKTQAWMSMDPTLRTQIKEGALAVLKSPVPIARHTSAQLVAKLGGIELEHRQWPNLLTELLNNVTSGTEGTIHASLECLGYLCDELPEDAIEQADTNRILTAIVDGIRSDRPASIRYAAVTALRNSLEFVGENFKNKPERDHIMQVICEATQSPDLKTRVVSFECIATIATLYYEYLVDYMQVLCELTFKAITSDQAEVGLQSLEFWSSMCDVEIELLEEAEYAQMEGRQPLITCSYYVQKVLGTLIPLLTETLKQQEEDQDEDSWNLSMAAATCLALVAQAVRNDCVAPCMTFITQNIRSDDWRSKEAAIMAFGSILDGPSSDHILGLVREALGLLMNCMNFDHILVRDTTAWTLGRICELHAESISAEMLPVLMELFVRGLDQEPRVSHNICYAIHNIVRAFEDAQGGAVHMLTPFFTTLFDKLLETSARSDATESNLRGSAYEAINMLVQVGAPEVKDHIMLRLPVILERLEASIQALLENPDDHRDDPSGLQANLCGVLIAAIQKLTETIGPLADRIMQALLQVFSTRNAAAAEEAFMAAGALANAVGKDFERYMQFFGPVLLGGLANSEEYMVCSVAVGVIGDLCRALEKNILPLCDQIMESLLSILRNPSLNRTVKPPVLSCFGDIALAIEGDFDRYLAPTMMMVMQAAEACTTVPVDDDEIAEYMNLLRESILEALTGIAQGLAGSGKASLLMEYTQSVGGFLNCIAADTQTRTESVTTAAVGLIGLVYFISVYSINTEYLFYLYIGIWVRIWANLLLHWAAKSLSRVYYGKSKQFLPKAKNWHAGFEEFTQI
jgi:importin subunit beta-1